MMTGEKAKGRRGRPPAIKKLEDNTRIIAPQVSISTKKESVTTRKLTPKELFDIRFSKEMQEKYNKKDDQRVNLTQPSVTSDNNNAYPPQFSQFTRTVYFYSNCYNSEKTHIANIRPGRYYACSLCHDFHLIRDVA